jgi:hypothetical protein
MSVGELQEAASGSALALLQACYASQCNGEWEHSYGVKIDTIDNPGWSVKIDLAWLTSVEIEGKEFKLDNGDGDWMHCSVKNAMFHGYGDPFKLETIIIYFLREIAPAIGRPT